MKETSKLKLRKPELSDDIHVTIDDLAFNFKTIDDVYEIDIDDVFKLKEGKTWYIPDKIWNKNPKSGDYVGWVNVREGKSAPRWMDSTSYSLGDLRVSLTDNGHIYEVVTAGTSCIRQPNLSVDAGSYTDDLGGAYNWQPDTNYDVGDVVLPTNGDKDYFYKCVTSGISSSTEPIWSTSPGTTFTDNTVMWETFKTVVWKEIGYACLFVPFGEIGVSGSGSGGTGGSSNTYIHDQDTSSRVWNIYHGLGNYPSVTTVDNVNEIIHGDVKYLSSNEVEVRFNVAISGKCYLNR